MSVVETSFIEKTPGVCGGKARVRNTRIAVWGLVLCRRLGRTDADLLEDYPSLSSADLDASWDYYRGHPNEIEQAIWLNDTAGNVPDGVKPPVWVIVSGRMLGLSDDEIREAFEPPLSAADLDAAWAEYRNDPRQVNDLARVINGTKEKSEAGRAGSPPEPAGQDTLGADTDIPVPLTMNFAKPLTLLDPDAELLASFEP
jgi:uncharacterized protein (DUF433 family)